MEEHSAEQTPTYAQIPSDGVQPEAPEQVVWQDMLTLTLWQLTLLGWDSSFVLQSTGWLGYERDSYSNKSEICHDVNLASR